MQSTWLSVLKDCGANLQNDLLIDFGDATAEASAALNDNIISDLSQFAVIEVSGDDAQSFLGGQLTSDIKKMDCGQSHLSAWCSAQGRVLAIFRVIRRPEAFWLQLPLELKDAVIGRLKMYVLRAKVDIADRSEDLVQVGLSGDAVPDFIARQLTAPPAKINHAVHADGYSVARIGGIKPRFVIIGQTEPLIKLWKQAEGILQPVGTAAWTLTDIESAQPWIVESTREQFLPQVLNLDALGGVSFNKGCYPGQEVITRLKFRGQVKQRLFRGQVTDSATVAPGTKLYLPQEDASVGEILLSAPHPAGGQALLAALRLDLADSRDLHLGASTGPICGFNPPPYLVET